MRRSARTCGLPNSCSGRIQRLFRKTSLAALMALAMLAGCGKAASEGEGPPVQGRGTIGLYTSLPIFWGEAHDPADLLASDGPPHWALAVLRDHGDLRLLDNLAAQSGSMPLEQGDALVLAQPYPLSPQENVALDKWVRGGGRVLLFADPMLTHDSAFALGDRRRPQPIALLSPILGRWGLQLEFDEAQPFGERDAALEAGALPVNLPGRFAALPGRDGCALQAGGLLAECRIGKGRVLALADAAVLEARPADQADSRRAVLTGLLDRLAN